MRSRLFLLFKEKIRYPKFFIFSPLVRLPSSPPVIMTLAAALFFLCCLKATLSGMRAVFVVVLRVVILVAEVDYTEILGEVEYDLLLHSRSGRAILVTNAQLRA